MGPSTKVEHVSFKSLLKERFHHVCGRTLEPKLLTADLYTSRIEVYDLRACS